MTEPHDDAARRIAARGRDALIARLRNAYQEAAAAHADVLELDSERLDAIVSGAAENADGLQWRRALATIGAEELGIELTPAFTHPAVSRAQAILGAPSYEERMSSLERPEIEREAAPRHRRRRWRWRR